MIVDGVLPTVEHAIFADTGWESDDVYEHLTYLETLMAQHDIQFHRVSKGNIRKDFLADDTRFASMPLFVRNATGEKAMVRRQCTSEYKINPLMKKQREIAGLKSGQRSKEHLVTTIIGISYDESQRMRDPHFPWIRHDYPLVDAKITRRHCIEYASKSGYRKPPRSACVGCPFKSDNEWRILRESPREWADAVEFDAALRMNARVKTRFNGEAFLHRSMKPLPEVDLRTDTERGIMQLFDMECEGMCGL